MSEPPTKRFRYATYNQRLGQISVDVGRTKGLSWDREDYDEDTDDSHTPFTAEIARLSLHDLTTGYQTFERSVTPLASSLSLTLLNINAISELFYSFYASFLPGSDHLDSGLESVLCLHHAFFETCLGEGLSQLPQTSHHLLRVGSLAQLDPKLVEKTFSTLSLILRLVSGPLLRSDSVATSTLRDTWAEVRPYLEPRGNKKYVRKCVADAWAGILRKARGQGMGNLMDVLFDEETAGLEAVLANALRGSGNTLHSRAVAIYENLLNRLSASPTADLLAMFRKVTTALVHHCSTSTIVPIVDSITSRLTPPGSSTDNGVPFASMLDLLSVSLFTRKGKRFPESKLRPTMLLLLGMAKSRIGSAEDDDLAIVTAVVGCLQAGQLQHWLSPGVQLIDKLWAGLTLQRRFAFASMLVTQKWAGVEQFLLPHLVKTTLPSLATDPLPTLRLLHSLAHAGYFSGGLMNVQGGRWREGLIAALLDLMGRLDIASAEAEPRRELSLILELLPLFDIKDARLGNQLDTIFSSVLKKCEGKGPTVLRDDWARHGPWNDGHVLSQILRCIHRLHGRTSSEVLAPIQERLLRPVGIESLLRNWHWNREVLSAAAGLVQIWSEDISIDAKALTLLRPNLLSADKALRSSTLHILSVLAPEEESREVWRIASQVEASEVTLRNARERANNVGKLGRHLLQLTRSDLSRDAISYLLSQFKVNFRPIYPEVVSALSGMATSSGEDIWDAVWAQICQVQEAESSRAADLTWAPPTWAAGERIPTGRVDEEDVDPDFACPSLTKAITSASVAWTADDRCGDLDVTAIRSQLPDDQLDILNYESQLVIMLGAIPSQAEKHSRQLVPFFLSIASSPFTSMLQSKISARLRQQRISAYLELFSKFVNPKAMYQSDKLHSLYLDIIAQGEVKLQSLALKCLMTYKSPSLTPYDEPLQGLLEDAKFRDQLSRLQLGVHSETIDPRHRAELLPVVIRLLYGFITSKRGRNSSAQGLHARKQAVLTALSGCTSDELSTLVDLMLEPFNSAKPIPAPPRQQLGFLTLLQDVLRYLAPQTLPHWPRLLQATTSLVDSAQATIDKELQDGAESVNSSPGDAGEDVPEEGPATGQLRNVRSTGIRRLVQFLRSPVDFDFAGFLPGIFAAAISPRLDKLEMENTQAPSGTLDLIAVLVSAPDTLVMLDGIEPRTLPKAFACMTAVKVKPAVIGRVLDIIESLLASAEAPAPLKVLQNHCQVLLDHVIRLIPTLSGTSGDDLLRRGLSILSALSSIVTDGKQAQQLASLLGPMLRRPGKQISEKSKADILTTLQRLYSLSPDFSDAQSQFFQSHFQLISNQLQTLHLSVSRKALLPVLRAFSETDSSLNNSVRLACDLNAYSKKRLDEPDFDKRLEAFAALTDVDASSLPDSATNWLPILRTTLFFIHEPEELSIRTNSSAVLRRFIDTVGSASDGPYVDLLQHVLLPGLRGAIRSKLELVRNEALLVIAHGVRVCFGLPTLAEMRPLLADGDDEANVFVNIGHIQVHRRVRAVRRLRDFFSEGIISENNLSNIFLPLLEHVINGASDISDHHLVNESVLSIGALAGRLRWSKYSSLIMRYLRLGSAKTTQQKYYIRTIAAIIDNFGFDLDAAIGQPEEISPPDEGDEDQDDRVERDEVAAINTKIAETVTERLLPALSKFLSSRDETDPSIRIPIALAVVKLAMRLPGDAGANEVVRVITTVAQILRSKEQDTRDIARDTIAKIAVFLGPAWLARTLGELRTALQRGPQKHVMAVTTHSILVLATTETSGRFTDLDEAVADSVGISAEAIWGESGQDVAAEGFKTKMREVRGASSRGMDTFQLVSRLASASKLGAILNPVREIMSASQAVKTMQLVDEVLRRISLGLNANSMLSPEDILSMCHSLISGNSGYSKPKRKATKEKEASETHRVQMKRDVKEAEDFFPLNAHKFVTFGLDLFVTAFRRGKFDFADVNILSRLAPLVNAIGNTLYSKTSSVLVLGLKAAAAITRCPISQVDEAMPVFIVNIFKIIKASGGTAESETAQTALKTLAVILRDCKAAKVSDTQLKYLLEVIEPDLEEASRQSAIFTLLRSVVGRQFVVPEIYDLMERVSSIMITSQSTQVQELCRGLLMQFLLEYPQGTGRLKSQMTFLARNLDYVFESGRLSVMEVLAAVFNKFSDDLIEEYGDMFFVALVAVLANDDSEKCRSTAGLLLQKLFTRFGRKHQQKTLEVLKGWVSGHGQEQSHALVSASLAVYALVAETDQATSAFVHEVVDVVSPIIASSATALRAAEQVDENVTLDHDVPRQALSVVAKIVKLPSLSGTDLPWSDVIAHLLFPHSWVRHAAAKSLVVLLSSGGSALDVLGSAEQLEVAQKCCMLFKSSHGAEGEYVVVDPKLADELVKILWNLAKHWANVEAALPKSNQDEQTTEAAEIEPNSEDPKHVGEESAEINKSPLSWLMSRMSFVVRQLIVDRPPSSQATHGGEPWIPPVMAILRFFAGTYENLSKSQAVQYLPHVLSPIHRILDDSELTSDSAQLDELRALATEVRDFIQSKVRSGEFTRVWEQLRQRTTEKRDERRQARVKMSVSDPQRWAERRDKRGSMKKEAKKRKTKAFAEGKMRGRPMKRRA